ncbi:hypothetical protein PM082_006682 [Marasmius tenuissimus]|nr:hypothetical protein PM082_006682 [Marasmius tenuissimus]
MSVTLSSPPAPPSKPPAAPVKPSSCLAARSARDRNYGPRSIDMSLSALVRMENGKTYIEGLKALRGITPASAAGKTVMKRANCLICILD